MGIPNIGIFANGKFAEEDYESALARVVASRPTEHGWRRPTMKWPSKKNEVDIHWNPKIGRDWMLCGQQKEVITPGQNEKRYLAGACKLACSKITKSYLEWPRLSGSVSGSRKSAVECIGNWPTARRAGGLPKEPKIIGETA